MVLELVAEAPASFSQRAATQGAHKTLEGPTGATLMGWAAGRCYDELGDHAFTVFHSGRVHFSDAVRIVDGVPVFPAPATLMRPKHGGGRICLGSAAYAEMHHSTEGGERPAADAVKAMHMSTGGALVPKADRRLRLRSAISRERRAAEDGKLFGTEALKARDVTYRAVIECEADILDDEVWAILQRVFSGKLSLGRARRSGYGGQYRVRPLDADGYPFVPPSLKGIEAGSIARFWLLSDAQFVDEWGQPRLFPDPNDFGLDPVDWALVPAETSVATRRVMPWNGVYGSRDMEAALVEAGSIIAFRRKAASNTLDALPHLIGTGHQRGYGRYCVIDPTIVIHELSLDATSPEALDAQGWNALSAEHADHSELLNWLEADGARSATVDDSSWTQDRINEARSRVNRMNGEHPSPAQWGELLDLVDGWVSGSPQFWDNLAKRLERDCWDRWYSGLGDWVKETLFAQPEPPLTRQQRARSVQRVIKTVRQYSPADASVSAMSGREGAR
jgi:hypothetical protein